jgi:hypothetical protein
LLASGEFDVHLSLFLGMFSAVLVCALSFGWIDGIETKPAGRINLYPNRAKKTCRFSIDALAHKALAKLQSVFHKSFIGTL